MSEIPDEDLHLVTALLETLSKEDISDKWEVPINKVMKYFKRHNISTAKVRYRYKAKFIRENSHESNFDLAIILDCTVGTILNTKRKMQREALSQITSGE